MQIFVFIARAATAAVRLPVNAITAGFNGLNGLVERAYDRFDADFNDRTKLLRARYTRETDLGANPPPTIGGVANRAALLTGHEVKSAA